MRALAFALALLAALPALAGETLPWERGSYAALLKEKAGRKLAVHFWSLSCAPCLAELPEWRKMAKGKGFDLVLVSTDSMDQAETMEGKLKRYGLADYPSHAFADSFTDKLLHEAAKDWRGEVPRTHLISPDGKTTVISGMMDMAALERWLGR